LKVEGIEPVEITCSLRRLSLPFQRLSNLFSFKLSTSRFKSAQSFKTKQQVPSNCRS
jgi:hypothetical protein